MNIVTKELYSKCKSWNTFYKKNSLSDTLTNESWRKFFNEQIFSDNRFISIENKLKDISNQSGAKLYPFPEKVFNAFNITSLDDLKVVIIGQDPYFNSEYYKGQYVPQATGLSFSVPVGMNTPSSLQNIFANQLKFGQIYNKPNHGDLTFWACQGCLMLNTALTVIDGQKNCTVQCGNG